MIYVQGLHYNQPFVKTKSFLLFITWAVFLCISNRGLAWSKPQVVLFENNITQLDTLTNGSLLIGDVKGFLFSYNGLGKKTLSDQAIGAIHDLLPYQGGHLICAKSGLYLFRKSRLKKLGQLNITANQVFIYKGHIYVCAEEGLFELKGEQLIEIIDRYQQLQSPSCFDYLTIDNETYLLGTSFIKNLANPLDTLFSQKMPITACVFTGKDVLIGDQTGLYILKSNKKRQVVLDGSTIQDPILDLFAPSENTWVISTESKSYLWETNTYSFKRVNHKISPQGQSVRDVQIDSWGSLWIAQGRFLHCPIKSDNTLPKITLKKITQNGQLLALEAAPFRFRNNENSFEVDFDALLLGNGEVASQYSLDGGESWLPINNNKVRVANLEAGSYTLIIRSSNDDKYFTYSPGISLTVAEKTIPIWLLSLLILGLGGLLLSLWLLWRSNEKRRTLNLEKEKLKAKNKALREEQKALQLQMNPHFIFNALNSIKALIGQNKKEKASEYLSSFSLLMRSTLDQSRKEWVKIEDELNYLRHYLSLERMTRNHAFDFTIDAPDEVLEEDLSTLPMILQPFVENAIVHGVSAMKSGGSITLRFSLDGVLLHVSIIDNGIGYKANITKTSHESVALEVVKDRLKGSRYKDARFSIRNRKEIDNNRGTRVDVYLPVR